MADSTQHKLSRVRPPRVQITYDVETGDAIEKKELPFVFGILADLSGAGTNELPLAERPFTEIDRDNFESVMAKLKPTLSLTVRDARAPEPADGEEPKTVNYQLAFTSLKDFLPDRLVEQLTTGDDDNPSISALWKRRNQLRDMLTKLDGNDPLLSRLTDASRSTKLLEDLSEKIKARAGKLPHTAADPAEPSDGEAAPARVEGADGEDQSQSRNEAVEGESDAGGKPQ